MKKVQKHDFIKVLYESFRLNINFRFLFASTYAIADILLLAEFVVNI